MYRFANVDISPHLSALVKLTLFQRRNLWWPTWRGWLLLFLVLVAPVIGWGAFGERILMRNERLAADTLVVESWIQPDGLHIAVREWERQLEWSQSDAAKFASHVLPTLAELTDERLRQRRGFTRASDPQRARELLGEPLWRFLAGPGRRGPKPRDLAEHVARMEQL